MDDHHLHLPDLVWLGRRHRDRDVGEPAKRVAASAHNGHASQTHLPRCLESRRQPAAPLADATQSHKDVPGPTENLDLSRENVIATRTIGPKSNGGRVGAQRKGWQSCPSENTVSADQLGHEMLGRESVATEATNQRLAVAGKAG